MDKKYLRALSVSHLAACLVFTGCAEATSVTSTIVIPNLQVPVQSIVITDSQSIPVDTLTTESLDLPVVETNPMIVIGVDGIFYPLALTSSVGVKADFKNEDCCNDHNC